jgi:hypothetical protein
MNAIEEIQNRLQKYPQAQAVIEGSRVTILPQDENGFTVSLLDNAPGYTVSFDAWHEEYEDVEKALDAFAFGLSDDCRLKVSYRGNLAHAWTVEEIDEGGQWVQCEWIGLNEVALLIPTVFWLKKRCVYLQNSLIQSGR